MTPDNITPNAIVHLLQILNENGPVLNTKVVTAGFDGFIDTIINVIKNKHPDKEADFFQSIEDFGKYVLEKKGASFSLEAEERSVKIGGNMPILANALGGLGARVNCIGAFGFPHRHKTFDDLSPNCSLFSFAEPGTSTAYEFNDGKMMVGNMGALNTTGWDHVKKSIGSDVLEKLCRESDLLCMVNWSEIEASGDIWKGFLKEILPRYANDKRQLSFFDLSDTSKRSDAAIIDLLKLLKEFAQITKVTLGLNKNEANRIHQVLYERSEHEFVKLGEKIFEKLEVDTVLLHSSREAFAINGKETVSVKSFFIENPRLSTGAGDNFNAGYNAARLLGMETKHCLMLAHAVSGYYVKTGKSPSFPEIVSFLKEQK